MPRHYFVQRAKPAIENQSLCFQYVPVDQPGLLCIDANRPHSMILLDRLDAFDGDEMTVIIETPKGSQNKYTYEPRFGTFVLDGVLPAGAVFPFDFGFVPSTIGEDGDPLDVLVLMDAGRLTGCIVASRLIGVIEAEQTENGKTFRNDRLIAVATKSITHRSLCDISDVSDDLVGEIEHFFISYNMAKGKTFEPKGRSGRERALTLVRTGIARADRP